MACAAVFGLPPFLLRGVDCFLLRMSCLFSKYLRRRVCATHEEVSFGQSVRSSYLVASDDRLRSRTASSDNNNPILPEPRVIVIVASSRRVVVARELAHLLDVTGRHDSLSESSNRALRVFVLTHSHLRRHRSPSSSSVAASARASRPSTHPSVRASSSSSVARAHLRLERALEREEVGKSTENERHRECSRRVASSSSSAASDDATGGNGAASLGRARPVDTSHTSSSHTSHYTYESTHRVSLSRLHSVPPRVDTPHTLGPLLDRGAAFSFSFVSCARPGRSGHASDSRIITPQSVPPSRAAARHTKYLARAAFEDRRGGRGTSEWND